MWLGPFVGLEHFQRPWMFARGAPRMAEVGAWLSCGVVRAVACLWDFYHGFLGSCCLALVDASWAVISLLNKVALASSSFAGRPSLWHSVTSLLRVIFSKLLAKSALSWEGKNGVARGGG